MAKLVLVNPPSTREERYGVHFRSGGETAPLGLAYLAAMTMKHDIETKIVDRAIPNNYEQIVNEIFKENPKYVGFTASTMNIFNAAKLAQMVKRENKSITTVIGGAHLTAVPIETMEMFTDFDIGVVGEGEQTLVELLDALEHTGDLCEVKGLLLRAGEAVVKTVTRSYIQNLDELPMPTWELLPDLAKTYCPPIHTVQRLPATTLITSRGCPYKCTFCDRSIFGNELRAHSANYVLNMIWELRDNFEIKEIQFRDDNFLAFRSRLTVLCGLLKETHANITFSILGHPNMVNPQILSTLKEAGCWQIWYGVESGSQRILDVIKKQSKLERVKEAIRWTKEAGISAGGFFMLGMPTETKEDIEATIRFSKELDLDEAHFTFFTPLPGTEIYTNAREYGEFDDDWRKMNMWSPLFVPKGLGIDELARYWKRASVGFYVRPRIIWNYARKIKSLNHLKVYGSGLMSLAEASLFKRYS